MSKDDPFGPASGVSASTVALGDVELNVLPAEPGFRWPKANRWVSSWTGRSR